MLANWTITGEADWREQLASWVPPGCDAWVWQREVADPGEYISLWLRDSGERPGTASWNQRYEVWRSWFDAAGVLAVGMGLVNLRRTGAAHPAIVCEDVPQAVEQPASASIDGWFERAAWLESQPASALLAARLRAVPQLIRDQRAVITPDGWQVAYQQLRQSVGMAWQVEVDDLVAGLVAACDGSVPVDAIVAILANVSEVAEDEIRAAVLPVVEDLFRRGLLLPEAP
jgi:hypothetical protein